MRKSSDDPRKAITVRIPENEFRVLRDYASSQGTSVNMIVSDAVSTETAKIRRLAALQGIAEFQKKFPRRYKSTAVELVREIRLERARQLAPDKSGKGDDK